jgi:beta-lactam-binding protein with PASTA domain
MDADLKRFIKHIVLFALLVALLVLGLSIGLRAYTRHSEVIVVPDVLTLTPEKAAMFLEKKGLRYKVVDSVHVRTQLPGVILEQKPEPGSHVKRNRIIFLTINAWTEEKVSLPDVKDFSYRQAMALLESVGLRVASVDYVPSEFRDLVLDVRYNGRPIEAGYKLNKGSYVSLTVGEGATSELTIIPDMTGLSLREAIDAAHNQSFNLGNIYYDVTPSDAENAKLYRVYKQSPEPGSSSTMGKKIDLWMTMDEARIQAAKKASSEQGSAVFIE